MNRKTGWFAALLILALLAVACGPTMATPTTTGNSGGGDATATAPDATSPTEAPTGNEPTVAPTEAVSVGELPVSADDWHVLGPADAKVTVIEYSDFQ